MRKSLPWFVCVSAWIVLLHGSADAQTQKRNFNLNCGLIGSFARYPQHNSLCKWQVFCTDPKTCIRKLAVPQKDLEAVLSQEESAAPIAGEPSQADTPDSGLSLSVSAQGSVSAGGLNASASANAGAGTDSGGGASGSASAGASAGGEAGGGNAGAGGGLGMGGL
jgi:hypothetical protein